VVGFLSAESIRSARRLRVCKGHEADEEDGIAVLAEKEEPAVCGVSEVWVLPSKRRSGIAFKLLEVLLGSFAFPSRMQRSAVAFSQPTRDGRRLGTKFFGTEEFLVYSKTT
jgi:N-acetyltransferase